jgi:transcriptional regulator with XRE-family HTH domain
MPRTKTPVRRYLTIPEFLTTLSSAAGEVPGPTLAEHLGTSRAQVARLLSGETDPKWSTLERAAQALGSLEGRPLRVRLVVEPTPTE